MTDSKVPDVVVQAHDSPIASEIVVQASQPGKPPSAFPSPKADTSDNSDASNDPQGGPSPEIGSPIPSGNLDSTENESQEVKYGKDSWPILPPKSPYKASSAQAKRYNIAYRKAVELAMIHAKQKGIDLPSKFTRTFNDPVPPNVSASLRQYYVPKLPALARGLKSLGSDVWEFIPEEELQQAGDDTLAADEIPHKTLSKKRKRKDVPSVPESSLQSPPVPTPTTIKKGNEYMPLASRKSHLYAGERFVPCIQCVKNAAGGKSLGVCIGTKKQGTKRCESCIEGNHKCEAVLQVILPFADLLLGTCLVLGLKHIDKVLISNGTMDRARTA
ncbi:hypothetical protein M406DRAFT_75453 [Cryphonectria parasitica EP155]|uniref:Uncharacterized protein n=1 Tax=Cryphonectria parasitica (strain ATCC 38755 / EP155) TaxID=660469 RepID=A0A9P4XR80_CRYP1|nr:uncharacterized protein M406DRAFT_75453 [Cryphonectria parasitica EP155]KAF3760102.1 hypothetical protein M406DRAFT_75453 [Cryphonectria parasitica EP155]